MRISNSGSQRKLFNSIFSISIFSIVCSLLFMNSERLFASERANKVGLTAIEAQMRSSHISDVTYQLHVNLKPDLPDYVGDVTSQFKYRGAIEPLTIDFEGGKITQLTVNGKIQESPKYNGHFLTLPADSLAEGPNEVKIKFSRVFSQASHGLYKFKDPEDGKIYFYTDFEPYSANEFFPCFDQPDLKARLKLSVLAPTDWQLISTTLEDQKKSEDAVFSTTTFPETPLMSPYLYSLHAGPYHVWKDHTVQSIPLRLFARESIAKYIEPEFWFTITRQGLDYYRTYFDYPYAFKKYDQIIVPDFNAGAMENIAAVTFSERFVSRGKMTRDEKENLAVVILHEMAHQWFGDLVTMKWWNDLWLNESFATFMASQALYEATEFKEGWVDFAAWTKRGAYYEDQLVTTHPISTPIDDTEHASNSFDSITYGKGASSLKQLAFAAGPTEFRDGVRNYLKKYQYSNATLSDFLASLQEKSPQFNAVRWSHDWLEMAGLNSVQPILTCEKGKIKDLTLIQSAVSGEKILRQHATNVALFDLRNGQLTLRKSIRVSYDGASTPISEFNGQDCPAFIFPNYEDQDYASVILSETDLKAALSNIATFPSPELRIGLWQVFMQMVRDDKLNIKIFFDTLLAEGPKDANIKVKNLAFSPLDVRTNFLTYLPTPGVAGSAYDVYVRRFESLSWDEFLKALPGSDEQVLWFDTYARVVESKGGLAKFANLLEDPSSVPKGFILDQDRKWTIVKALARQNAPQLAKNLAIQEKTDSSNNGKLAALTSKAASAKGNVKKAYWNQIIDPKTKYKQAELKALMRDFFPRSKPDIRSRYGKDFYAILKLDLSHSDRDWLRSFASSLRPLTCSSGDLKIMKDFLAEYLAKLPPAVVKTLRVAVQEDERCIAARI